MPEIAGESAGRTNRSLQFVGTFGIGITTAAAIVSDVLAPLAPFALYLFLAMFALLLVSVAVYWAPRASALAKKVLGEIWYAPLAITQGLAAIVFLGTYLVGASTGTDYGVLANRFPAIRKLQSDLDLVAQNTGRIAVATEKIEGHTKEISKKMDHVKRETSENPRKELANQGIDWNPAGFLEAISLGDIGTTVLFLDGGMQMVTARNQGRPLPIMLSKNKANPREMLALLVERGLDVNYEFDAGNISGPKTTTLLTWAIENENPELIRALAEAGADLNQMIEAFGPFGTGVSETPLTLAVRRDSFDLASLLVELGAKPEEQDYAAYRISKDKALKLGDRSPPELTKAVDDLAPGVGSARRVDAEVQAFHSESTRGARIKQLNEKIYTIDLQIMSKTLGGSTPQEEREVLKLGEERDLLTAELERLSQR